MFGNAMTRFLGGSPTGVLVRLIAVSFVVGLLLEMFGFDPGSLFHQAIRALRHLVDFGFTDLRQIGHVLLTGAMVVIPVWIVLRLLDFGRTR